MNNWSASIIIVVMIFAPFGCD